MKQVDLFGCEVFLRCRQTDRYVRYNESWIDYEFLRPWELVDSIERATPNPACICNRDFTEAMLTYLKQFYEIVKVELEIIRTITFEKELFMELSNGGKTIFLCNNCYSPKIKLFKTTEAIVVATDNGPRYTTIRPNTCLCGDCGSMFSWSHRVKLPTKLLDRDLDVCTPRVEKLVNNLGYWAKRMPEGQLQTIVDVVLGDRRDQAEVEYRIFPELIQQTVTVDEHGVRTNEDGTVWSPKSKDDFSHWTHGPNWFGVWAPYNGWRFKDHYNIELWNGEIIYGVYPNANSWHVGGIDINDWHVRRVQLCRSEECPRWAGRDDDEKKNEYYLYRARRNAEMFAHKDIKGWVPVANEELKGIDPYSPDLTDEQKLAITEECKENPWYFFSMVYRGMMEKGEVEV